MSIPLRVKTAGAALLCSLVLASSAFADTSEDVDRRCEEGGYVDSAELCDLRAKIADEFGKPPEVGQAFRLRAARHRLWQCKDPTSEPCLQALDRLWAESEDPAEVTMAAALYQQGCAQTHTAAACMRASAAAWHGRGVPVDAVASLAWARQCTSCTTFTPDVLAPPHAAMEWAKTDEQTDLARIRALAAAGALAEAEAVLQRARERKDLSAPAATTLADELGTALWRVEVEPHVAHGQPLVALGAAEQLVDRFGSPRLREQRNRLRATLQAVQLDQMRQASAARLPQAARFHALWADALGADVVVPAATDPFADLPSNVKLTGLPSSCDWLAPGLDLRYRPERARTEIRASLVCTHTTEQRTVTTTTTANEEVREPRTRTVPGECSQTRVLCVGGYKTSDWCIKTECTPAREVTYYEKVVKPVTRTKHEQKQHTRATVRGRLDGPFGTATIDFDQGGFDGVDDGALAAVAREVDRMVQPVKDAQLAKERAGAKAAPSALVRQEHLLRAMALGLPATALAEATGLTSQQLDELLEYARFALPAPPAPATGPLALAAPTAIDSGFSTARFPAPTRPAMSGPTEDVSTTMVAGPRRGPSSPRLPRGLLFGAGALRRAGGMVEGTGAGVRVEHGLQLARSFRLTHVVMLAGGYDAELGPSFDARAGVATGVRTGAVTAQYMLGLGFGVLGARDEQTGASRSESGADLFHGADLTIGKDRGLALHGRFLFVMGGPIDSGTRITGELLYRRVAGDEVGLAITRHHVENGENVVGLGLLYRTARSR